jgi:diacylglycerol kinase family enzyme
MAGAGFDAEMIDEADGALKERFGRFAYIVTGARSMRELPAVSMKIKVDGEKWFKGEASCVLVGNVGTAIGGLEVFPDALPDDGRLELGVVTASGVLDWSRTLGRAVVGNVERSPFVRAVSGKRFAIDLGDELMYELDGGERTETDRIRVKVEPRAITVRVPEEATT